MTTIAQTPQQKLEIIFDLNLHLNQKQRKNTALKSHRKIYVNSQPAALVSIFRLEFIAELTMVPSLFSSRPWACQKEALEASPFHHPLEGEGHSLLPFLLPFQALVVQAKQVAIIEHTYSAVQLLPSLLVL